MMGKKPALTALAAVMLLHGCDDNSRGNEVNEVTESRSSLDPNARANPQYIIDAKHGHLATCSETIEVQVNSVGAGVSQDGVRNYCECLGNFYFNELTNAELDEVIRGALPARIEADRVAIQQRCAALHMPELSF